MRIPRLIALLGPAAGNTRASWPFAIAADDLLVPSPSVKLPRLMARDWR